MAYHRLAVILGNCLFPNLEALKPDKHTLFFMAEDTGLCTHFKYHKHKLMLFLSAMRSYHDSLQEKYPTNYWKLSEENQSLTYEDKLKKTLSNYARIEEIVMFTIEDNFFAQRIEGFCEKQGLQLTIVDSPGFYSTVDDFQKYLDNSKRPFMQYFYTGQRKKYNLLVNEQNEPLHGKWSFDEENRKKLPKDIAIPTQPESEWTEHTQDVAKLVDKLFPDHPGDSQNFWLATTRRQALYRLRDFMENRFADFGPYEDAIDSERNFLFHSVLSPYINLGLITAKEVIDSALEYAEQHDVHYPSVEGFVRQIVGWREFMRGMYHTHNLRGNFFDNQRKLKDCWYDGTTGIPPLDDSIKRVAEHGYTHHIERLMVLGNIMLLTEVHPDEVYKWFMEMFVDSSDWVMEPNVYGMSQFADGGTFATKPYIGGSNYISKMSDYRKSKEWADTVDGLYWSFIDRHRNVFAENQRMSMMIATLDKMNHKRKEHIFQEAEDFRERTTL
ncbi:cryptochrome/photolyase family protein [Tunicatimonas pelagia]|uniref:cryptochrome/photolyase family protein n=1 Tax=Tunicatimonas pelagia TaxID=931531 RepID=UPI00266584B3|nr:cryptochrome/photolyase family protein [Tunicatimonas pelagia]WKN40574.1 cryptochrome/photolyase family protein [Tunicatimonas pelagia]